MTRQDSDSRVSKDTSIERYLARLCVTNEVSLLDVIRVAKKLERINALDHDDAVAAVMLHHPAGKNK